MLKKITLFRYDFTHNWLTSTLLLLKTSNLSKNSFIFLEKVLENFFDQDIINDINKNLSIYKITYNK